ncbi:hypothetical protein GF323_04710 [Candidatus Woesearchaeota archaeon]|nr:hypothetical protein [Candidatus Woesearchaeota archaeon]
MKIMVSIMSALIIAAGILHFFDNLFIPTKDMGYSAVLIVLGVVLIASSIVNKLLIGFERFFLFVQGILLIGVAVLPFFSALLPVIPKQGPVYAGMVIIIGAIGLLYGVLGMC